MKNIIIILGCIILGCYIFNLLLNDEGSIKQTQGKLMERQVEGYIVVP